MVGIPAMNDMDKLMMQWTVNFGRVVLVSMFLPLAVLHGCPRRSKKVAS